MPFLSSVYPILSVISTSGIPTRWGFVPPPARPESAAPSASPFAGSEPLTGILASARAGIRARVERRRFRRNERQQRQDHHDDQADPELDEIDRIPHLVGRFLFIVLGELERGMLHRAGFRAGVKPGDGGLGEAPGGLERLGDPARR